MIVVEEKHWALHVLIVCPQPNYPAFSVHAPYYIVICVLSASKFSTFSHKLHDCREKIIGLLNIKYILDILCNVCMKYLPF
jgi:hypothetical protein